MNTLTSPVYDFIVIGSGFGGSISAMRLVEKGYSVLVVERGKRFRDEDFAKSNWLFWKYLWAPGLRSFGILQISPFKNLFALHGSGVGGGSLGYANVLLEPSDELFEHPFWKHLLDWKSTLAPHFATAKRMLGVTINPILWPADWTLKQVATELGTESTFRPTPVGTFFGVPGDEGKIVPDPYFGGEGPERQSCTHCGGCMVGCRQNAKNTLVKNYLYFAEKWGADVWAECEVRDIRPLPDNQPDGARYEVSYRNSTRWLFNPEGIVRARNIVVSAGALGTMRLLFRCREITKSLPKISIRLGDMVRTNNEALMGVVSKKRKVNYSEGVAITSIVQVDDVTCVEPVRYPSGSSLMRLMAGPMIETSGSIFKRLLKTIGNFIIHPVNFYHTHLKPGWAENTTILLVMQTEDNWLHMRFGRDLFTLWRRNLVTLGHEKHFQLTQIKIGHSVTRRFSEKIDAIPATSINESVLNVPLTAHILGGCPIGENVEDGVVGLDCQMHNYPGIYVVDGSIMPGNPGVNPSLTIAALSEYAMSLVPLKVGANHRSPIGINLSSIT